MDTYLGRRLFEKKPVAEGHYLKVMDPKLRKDWQIHVGIKNQRNGIIFEKEAL